MTYRCAAAFRMMGASLIWNGTICAAETWTLTQTDRRRLEDFEMWIWRRMEKIS